MRKIALSICFLLCSINVSAITLPTSDLPSELQNCFLSGDCVAAITPRGQWTSDFETTGAAAFSYQQWNGSSYDSRWLMRYDLLVPPGTMTGTAWVSTLNSYNIAGSDMHSFSLYYGNTASPPLTLTLNDTDLADGSAFRSQVAAWIETEPGVFEFGSIASGDLSGIDLPLCLAENCGSSAYFNLLHMDFAGGMFSFDPYDSRGRLFSTHQWYDCGSEDCGGYSATQSMYVHAVPVPAALPLMIGGLAAMGAAAHRRRVDVR